MDDFIVTLVCGSRQAHGIVADVQREALDSMQSFVTYETAVEAADAAYQAGRKAALEEAARVIDKRLQEAPRNVYEDDYFYGLEEAIDLVEDLQRKDSDDE